MATIAVVLEHRQSALYAPAKPGQRRDPIYSLRQLGWCLQFGPQQDRLFQTGQTQLLAMATAMAVVPVIIYGNACFLADLKRRFCLGIGVDRSSP